MSSKAVVIKVETTTAVEQQVRKVTNTSFVCCSKKKCFMNETTSINVLGKYQKHSTRCQSVAKGVQGQGESVGTQAIRRSSQGIHQIQVVSFARFTLP